MRKVLDYIIYAISIEKKKYANWSIRKRLMEKYLCHIDDKCYINIESEESLELAKDVYLAHDVIITSVSKGEVKALVSIGKNTSVGEYSDIRAGASKIVIGENCLIAPFVSLIGTNHLTSKEKLIRENEWDTNRNFIVIGNDVWIGSHSVILPGVIIGNGAVVAAGAIVNRNVEEYSIVGGIPAKKIATRL